MSKVCIKCGKGKVSGNNVSHSHKKTKRTFNANIHKGTVIIGGEEACGYVCTRCLRTEKKQAD